MVKSCGSDLDSGLCKFLSRPRVWTVISYLADMLSLTSGAGLACILDRHTRVAIVVVVLGIVGVGVGCVFQPTLVALQAHVPRARRAVITSNRNFFRCVGGACGLAVSAAILQTTLRTHLPARLSYVAKSSYAIQAVPDSDLEIVLDAYMSASHAVFILQAPLIGLCLLGCCLIKDRGLQCPEVPRLEPQTRSRLEGTDDKMGGKLPAREKVVTDQA